MNTLHRNRLFGYYRRVLAWQADLRMAAGIFKEGEFPEAEASFNQAVLNLEAAEAQILHILRTQPVKQRPRLGKTP